ncbi:MAG: asd [Alphaproteobacteria bacterium]|nr:asd [Alphaproteobacteria bacterium]
MKLSKARIVVTNVTTLTGRDVLTILAEKDADKGNVLALDPGRSGGEDASFGDNAIVPVKPSGHYTFEKDQIIIHTGPAVEAAAFAKKAQAVGALFIDGSGAFAFDPDVPLIVPEVNGALLKEPLAKNIIASPNSIAILASLGLNPLNIKAQLSRVVISTYQAVSHWGREAQDELFNQTKAMFMTKTIPPEIFPKQIAFNCYPMLGAERDDGMTETEWQAIAQLKKILGTKIKIAVNTVTIPSFIGDGMAINATCTNDVSPIKAAMWMTGQKGLGVVENGEDLPTHADIGGEDYTYVARLRDDFSAENSISFWLIGDNLRKGSALNLVQIAEAYLSGR